MSKVFPQAKQHESTTKKLTNRSGYSPLQIYTFSLGPTSPFQIHQYNPAPNENASTLDILIPMIFLDFLELANSLPFGQSSTTPSILSPSRCPDKPAIPGVLGLFFLLCFLRFGQTIVIDWSFDAEILKLLC